MARAVSEAARLMGLIRGIEYRRRDSAESIREGRSADPSGHLRLWRGR